MRSERSFLLFWNGHRQSNQKAKSQFNLLYFATFSSSFSDISLKGEYRSFLSLPYLLSPLHLKSSFLSTLAPKKRNDDDDDDDDDNNTTLPTPFFNL